MTEIRKPFMPPSRDALRESAMASLVRACIVAAKQVVEPSARNAWPDDRNVDLVLRSAVRPTSMADMSALANIAVAFVASLVPVSAAAAVIARSLQLSFDGAAAISVPTLSLPNAAFVGEGKPIPVSQGTATKGPLLEPYKLAMMVSLTGEMIRGSNAEAFVRQVLLENSGPSLDLAMFSANAAVPGLSPAGLLNGIAPLPPTAGGSSNAMVKDITAIATALVPVAGASPPILICAPAQYVAVRMLAMADPMSVLTSAALPAGTVVGLVPASIATAVDTPRVETSSEAIVHMENATPADIVDIGGVPASPVKSMWQTDSVSLRLTHPVAWARRSANAVAWIQNVTW